MVNLNNVVTNRLLLNKGIKIQDGCQSNSIISAAGLLVSHHQLFWKKDNPPINMPKQIDLIPVLVFTTYTGVDSENLGLHGPVSAIFSISTIISRWVKTMNFYSSSSNYHRCMVFTSRYLFSMQKRKIEWARNILPVSKPPSMQYGYHGYHAIRLPNAWAIIYQTIWN